MGAIASAIMRVGKNNEYGKSLLSDSSLHSKECLLPISALHLRLLLRKRSLNGNYQRFVC
jgi:hypothetical protein